jgi:hypothetical protein
VTATETPGAANTGGKGIVSTAKRDRPLNQIARNKQNRPKGRSPKSFAVARAPLKCPEPKPAAPPQPAFEIGRPGLWILLGRDFLGKRALAKCSGCGAVHEISIADDTIARCGCSSSRRPGAETFASTVAAAERIVAASRHRGRR